MPDCNKPTIDAMCDCDGPDVGQIVNLVSGSPDLTVLSSCDECGDVHVAWFAGDDLQIAVLPMEALF